jgi:hypothetical protein
VVAFVGSILVALVGMGAVTAYGKRRPIGAPLSWGEAIAAATFAFWLMFWAYGVVPHQWLTWADNQLNWRPDKILFGPGDIFSDLPFTITYQTLRDLVVVVIYGAALTLHVAQWMHWQNRSKTKAIVVPTTAYGRPLVRKG